MKKLLKIFIFSLLLFFSVATISATTQAWYVQLILVHYQYEDGSTAAPSYREENPEYGVTYHIDSPKIDGYIPDKEYVECTFNGLKVFWVTYYKNGYSLKINYIDEEGNTLASSYNKVLNKNSEYSIESPTIDGYIPNIEVVSGTLEADTEVNVIYTRNKYNLVINYKDIDGNKVYDSYNESLLKNSEYNIESPAIEGHTPNINIVSGTLDSDKEMDVIYSKNDYVLTINYLDELGNTIKESSYYDFKYNDNYNIEVPAINGYSIDIESINGVIKNNKEIDLVYKANKYLLTINYIDEGNKILADPYSEELNYGTNYNIKSPDIYGYRPYLEYVSGKLEEDTTINVYYSLNDYVVIINYVDEEGNPLSDRYYASMKYGSTFNEPSPIIYGYTPDYDNISGVLDKNLEYTVTYTKNDYTLTIKYLDSDGNQLIEDYVEVLKYNTDYNIDTPNIDGYAPNINNVFGTLTRDTEIIISYTANYYNLIINCIDISNNRLINTYTYNLKYNKKYEIVTPEIEGYYTNDKSICGVMTNYGVVLDIYYHEHRIIHDGVQVAVTVTMTLTNMVALLYISFNILGKHGLC